MWSAVKRDDGSLVVPVHVGTPEGWHADGAVIVTPGDPHYDLHAATAITFSGLAGDPQEDAALLARWEARFVQTERP
ncbi:hypothetical protein N5079_22670 [Planotetraspora sp. A-T 1434]|uniref:hypothetical protein n=1 Tax=Planotetraspora sp. A-T 1434 TaxID=2979219 RepID=UPI0021C08C47|nr:hypothetical protein [Planotetraspora sp. A-T 1434]MCT9933017.1 hypothetical protein [Planotetraspora sp. A-T 1434]